MLKEPVFITRLHDSGAAGYVYGLLGGAMLYASSYLTGERGWFMDVALPIGMGISAAGLFIWWAERSVNDTVQGSLRRLAKEAEAELKLRGRD